jgi:hypothetical protein
MGAAHLMSGTERLRKAFGVMLFVAWTLATFVWVASTIDLTIHGNAMAAASAAAALALLLLLGGMEGLEVSVIDRWQKVWPGASTTLLAKFLAARQLFVALIVTAATLLANRSEIVVPASGVRLTNGFALSIFDLLWTTLTVLWFAQIFPKHLAATNPDRYLAGLQRSLFPVVKLVHLLGISQPGEWTADVFEGWMQWPAAPGEIERHHHPGHELSIGSIWRELRKHEHRAEHDPAVGPGQAAS